MKYDISKCERVRRVNGWTKTFVAARARVSKAVVSNFFNSKPVRIDSAKKIVTALGLEMQDVLKGRVA